MTVITEHRGLNIQHVTTELALAFGDLCLKHKQLVLEATLISKAILFHCVQDTTLHSIMLNACRMAALTLLSVILQSCRFAMFPYQQQLFKDLCYHLNARI